MDSILVIGNEASNLTEFLERLGYGVIKESPGEYESTLTNILVDNILDLSIVDASEDLGSAQDITTFLREHPTTQTIPLVVLTDEGLEKPPTDAFPYENVEFIEKGSSIGLIASKIALLLRLRKFKGDGPSAHIAEMNAALRDYSERMAKDLEDARKIQLNTLPASIPESPSFSISYSFEPLEELGGDWFFIQKEPSGKISFLLADVTGHGLAAAFIGVWIKLALWTSKHEEPHLRMAEINKLLAPQLPDGRFITMCCSLYCPETGKISQARAGHPPSLVHRDETNEVKEMLGDGFAVGFFDEGEYSIEEHTLGIGDSYVMMTDGIIEAQDRDDKFYGTQGVTKVLFDSKLEYSAKIIQDKILEDFQKFISGRILKDDVSIIVLKRLA